MMFQLYELFVYRVIFCMCHRGFPLVNACHDIVDVHDFVREIDIKI